MKNLEETNKIVAILVTYNGIKWIHECIESIRQSKENISVILIDNNSSDGTKEYVLKNFPWVKVLENDRNLGFGQANNLGIKEALKMDAKFLLLINQDVYLKEDTISELLKFNDNRSLLSCLHLNGDSTSFDKNFLQNTVNTIESYKNIGLKDFSNFTHEPFFETSFVNAAFWFLPINLIKDIGGFNPLFYHYGEDNNFIHRVKFHNFKIKIVSGTYICHDRVQYGNKRLFNKDQYYRNILLNNLNINMSIYDLLLFNLRIIIKCLFLITKLEFVKAKNLFLAFFQAIKKTKTINQSRKYEKVKGLNWIL